MTYLLRLKDMGVTMYLWLACKYCKYPSFTSCVRRQQANKTALLKSRENTERFGVRGISSNPPAGLYSKEIL